MTKAKKVESKKIIELIAPVRVARMMAEALMRANPGNAVEFNLVDAVIVIKIKDNEPLE